jgi:hypothetical protein
MRVITRVLQLGRVVKQVPKMSERSKYVREFRGPRLQCLFRKSLLEELRARIQSKRSAGGSVDWDWSAAHAADVTGCSGFTQP